MWDIFDIVTARGTLSIKQLIVGYTTIEAERKQDVSFQESQMRTYNNELPPIKPKFTPKEGTY